MKHFKKGDKVFVQDCFSDFKKEYIEQWYEGEFVAYCSRLSVYKYRVKVGNKMSDWKNIKK